MALSNEAKAEIIRQRLVQLEVDKFHAELDQQVATAVGDTDAADASMNVISELDSKIAVHESELDSFKTSL